MLTAYTNKQNGNDWKGTGIQAFDGFTGEQQEECTGLISELLRLKAWNSFT